MTASDEWQILGTALKPRLLPVDSRALDFGCGSGRFTRKIAELVHGHCYGYDPRGEFDGDQPEYVTLTAAFPPGRFDLVFVADVLGRMDWDGVAEAAERIRGALRPRGLLFMAERLGREYDGLFEGVGKVGEYLCGGRWVGMFAGRVG